MTIEVSGDDGRDQCPHGCGPLTSPVGDPLDPDAPYCATCGHIRGKPCSDGCHYDGGDDD